MRPQTKDLLIVFLAAALGGSIVLTSIPYFSGNDGWYNHGIITLKAYRIDTHQYYSWLADHEWAHYLWDKKMTLEEKSAWTAAVNTCGYDGHNYLKVKSIDSKAAEEWADNYAGSYQNESVCLEKTWIILVMRMEE